jgi:hypothetical protein
MGITIREFAMKGLLARHCVLDLQQKGLLRSPAVTPDERQEQDLMAPVTERVRVGSLSMQRNYRVLYVLENIVRNFVTTRLTEVDGTTWFDSRANTAMKDKVQKRKNDEAKNQWHVGRNQEPEYYLDFGDLSLLIKNHWTVFRDFFDNQTWVESRMQDAERTRNVIAHTNLLAQEEAERLEMHLRDWLKQIG